MNSASLWRLQIAKKVAASYVKNPNVDAIVVAGSVARDWADQYSDIELNIFWSKPPTYEERVEAIKDANGVLLHFFPYEENEWSKVYTVDNMKIEISQFLVSTIEQYIADVVKQFDITYSKQILLASIQHSIPLHGHHMIEQWKTQISNYPLELRYSMVKQHLDFECLWYYEPLACRNDFFMLNDVFSSVIKNILGVLIGLNCIYLPHPKYKWIDRLINEMEIVPHNLSNRLKQVFRSESVIAIKILQEIAEEVFVLVETHMPDLVFQKPQKRRISDIK